MGILNRIFTRREPGEARLQQIEMRVLSEIQKVSDRLDELQSEHRKLRGRFYQARGELESNEKTLSREEMKAQAFAKIGYVPGKPAVHRS